MGGGGMTGVGVEGETLSSVAVGAGMVGLGVAVVGVTSGVDPADGGVGGGEMCIRDSARGVQQQTAALRRVPPDEHAQTVLHIAGGSQRHAAAALCQIETACLVWRLAEHEAPHATCAQRQRRMCCLLYTSRCV